MLAQVNEEQGGQPEVDQEEEEAVADGLRNYERRMERKEHIKDPGPTTRGRHEWQVLCGLGR